MINQLLEMGKQRYQVFVNELNRKYVKNISKIPQCIIEPEDYRNAINILFKYNNKIIGGVRFNLMTENMLNDLKFYQNYSGNHDIISHKNVLYASRLFIIPEFRKRRWLAFYLAKIYVLLKKKDYKYIYMNTCKRLIKMYKSIGFEIINKPFYLAEVNDMVIPMMFRYDNEIHKRVSSKIFWHYVNQLEGQME